MYYVTTRDVKVSSFVLCCSFCTHTYLSRNAVFGQSLDSPCHRTVCHTKGRAGGYYLKCGLSG